MAVLSSETLHASTVAIDGRAVVIEGPSGAGKSDLALRLVDRGARLVSDDYTVIVRTREGLVARPPATIAGKIEVRDVGIVTIEHCPEAPVALVIRIDEAPVRMPERRVRRIAGIEVRVIALDPRPPSAPIKVEMALRHPDAAA